MSQIVPYLLHLLTCLILTKLFYVSTILTPTLSIKDRDTKRLNNLPKVT